MRRFFAVFLFAFLGWTAAVPAEGQSRTFLAYVGPYDSQVTYHVNDMVSVGAAYYLSLTASNTDNAPGSNGAQWSPLVSGAAGTAGVAGPSGPAGASGAIGPAGAVGLTGVAGLSGARGSTGSTGLAGSAGAPGSEGAPGIAGIPGAIGAAGPAGVSGISGAMGPMGPQGLAGVAGTNGTDGTAGTANSAGVVRETRTLRVAAIKGYNVAPGGSLTLFSATGPGNVERIQLAMTYNSGSPSAYAIGPDTMLTIAVDGRVSRCTLGMFLLWYGYTTSDGTAATGDLFESKYLGITSGTSDGNATNSGYRRIYIKYDASISISVTLPAGEPNAIVYSQVEYYAGAAPEGRFAATRNVFHLVVSDWASSTIGPNALFSILPTVGGSGELESVYFVSSGPAGGRTGWLEQTPDVLVDGADFRYGGTEDFFGNQFYGDQFHGRADEYGMARDFSSSAPDNTRYWSGYRYFRESPMVFNSSLGMTWLNATLENAPATRVGALVVYYTVN